MSETELGKLTVVSPSVPPLTSISSASVNRVSNSLTSSVSQTQCTRQESGQASQNVMVEINMLVGKGIIEYTDHEKGEFISPIFFCSKSDGTRRLILNLKILNEFLE